VVKQKTDGTEAQSTAVSVTIKGDTVLPLAQKRS
jgi:hypothetical protein